MGEAVGIVWGVWGSLGLHLVSHCLNNWYSIFWLVWLGWTGQSRRACQRL